MEYEQVASVDRCDNSNVSDNFERSGMLVCMGNEAD